MERRGRDRKRNGQRRAVVALTGLVTAFTLASAGPAWSEGHDDNAPSDRGVAPIVTSTGNSAPGQECRTLTGLDDANALQIAGEAGGFPSGSPYSDGTLQVTISDWDSVAKSFDWSSNVPVLGVWVKGGSGGEGNWYDYRSFADQPPAAGADRDGALHTKPNPNGPAGLSHVTFCYGDGPQDGAPDLEIGKSSDAGTLHEGDRFTYTLTVRNVGDATARKIEVSDQIPLGASVILSPSLPVISTGGYCSVLGGGSPDGPFANFVHCEPKDLPPGESATITIWVEVEGTECGAIENVARVKAGNEPKGNVDDANSDSVTDVVDCNPSILLEKSVSPESGNPGDIVAYTYVVTNTGDVTLYDISVDDDVVGHIGTLVVLAPGKSKTLSTTYELPSDQVRVVNTAEACGTDGSGTDVCAEDRAEVTIVSAGGGDDDGEEPGGTAFTGPADPPAMLALVLALLGSLMLLIARRRTAGCTG